MFDIGSLTEQPNMVTYGVSGSYGYRYGLVEPPTNCRTGMYEWHSFDFSEKLPTIYHLAFSGSCLASNASGAALPTYRVRFHPV